MSHFTVMVFGDDIEEQLQPFHEFECTGINDEYVEDVDVTGELQERIKDGEGLEDALDWYGLSDKTVEDESEVDTDEDHKYGYAIVKDDVLIKAVNRTNPNRQWDWYQIGGRWSGFLKLKEGATGDNGERSWANPGENDASHCDSALKGDIDIEGMRNDKAREAGERWDNVYEITGGDTWESFESVRGRIDNIDDAREFYWDQPTVKALRGLQFWSLDEFLVSREEFVADARNSAISTFAILKDGEWYERGDMGWWGCVSDEVDQDEWNAQVAKLIDEVSDDTRITIVDCHI